MTEQKWRGIKTNAKKRKENKPRTIRNRMGQLSVSLPRIDDKKRWAGYPGLAGTARKIAKLIPPCNFYIEPFAGTAKVWQEFHKKRPLNEFSILNDKSEFICKWLKEEFAEPIVTNEDFTTCMQRFEHRPDAVFVIDPPWNRSYYDQKFSCFDRDSLKIYDEQILYRCSKLRGKFIITTRKENKRMLNSGYNNKLIKSEYVVSGKYPKVLITTNLEV